MVLSKGYSIPEAANSLGVSKSALRKWVRAEQGGNISHANSPSSPLSLNEHEELLRLRKVNTRLKMEREILKNNQKTQSYSVK